MGHAQGWGPVWATTEPQQAERNGCDKETSVQKKRQTKQRHKRQMSTHRVHEQCTRKRGHTKTTRQHTRGNNMKHP